MAHRSFPRTPRPEDERTTFDFGPGTPTFTANDDIPYATFSDLTDALATSETDPQAVIGAVQRFYSATVHPEDQQAFADFIRSPQGPGFAQMTEVAMWLMEQLADRPTDALSSSDGGRANGQTTSTAGADSPGSASPTSP